jgi:hypothetical protein
VPSSSSRPTTTRARPVNAIRNNETTINRASQATLLSSGRWTACMSRHHHLAHLPCNHSYCTSCLTEIFTAAVNQEPNYPPRCCEPIPLYIARPFLSRRLARDYEEKKEEWECKDRTYCSNPDCGRWISPEFCEEKNGLCQHCSLVTCRLRKAAAHVGRPCPEDAEMQRVVNMLERNRWRRCPRCGTGIERNGGCNHIRFVDNLQR